LGMKKIWLVLAIAVFIFVQAGSLVFAGDSKYTRRTLKGLKGVNVVAESLSPEIEKEGLTVRLIKTFMELELRRAGINVLTEEESLKEKGRPFLHVTPTVMKENMGGYHIYIFNISLDFKQDVFLKRDPNIHIGSLYSASTWSTGYTGKTGFLRDIRLVIKEQINIFINAYLSVNPK